MNKLFTRAEFSRACGVTKAAIGKAIKSGRVILDSNNFINIRNEINQGYFQKKAGSNIETDQPPKKKKRPIEPDVIDLNDNESLPDELQGMTIDDLYNDDLFTGVPLPVLEKREKVLKIRTSREREQILNEIKRNTLVEQRMVKVLIFEYLNILSNQILDLEHAVSSKITPLLLKNKKVDSVQLTIQVKAILKKALEKILKESKRKLKENLNKLDESNRQIEEEKQDGKK